MQKLTRKIIEENTVGFYRNAGGTHPDLRVVQLDDKKLIVKDFRHSDFLFRVIVGPILIRREYGALCKLIGVEGIPQVAGRIDRYALAMEHIPGTSLEHISQGVLDNGFYSNLRSVIDNMHSRGVTHCDLRSRGNIMLGENGLPYVVDFAACVYKGKGINPFIRWLFHQFVLADRRAVLIAKRRLSPELITDEDQDELNTPLPFEGPAKAFGCSVRNITRFFLTKK